MFLLRAAFWLGLALLIIQPHGMDIGDTASQLSAAAVETGRTAALDSIDQLVCETIECAGAKVIARSALASSPTAEDRVIGAPFPAPPLNRMSS